LKVENGVVFNANEPLGALLKLEWPVKVSYELAKLASKLSTQFDVIEQVRQGLVRRYGTEDGNGQYSVSDTSQQYEQFVAEYKELMGQEVEIAADKVALPSEVDGKSIMVEAATLMRLEDFIEVS